MARRTSLKRRAIEGEDMPTDHREGICDALNRATEAYINHQEDDLLVPVLERQMYLGVIDHFVRVLAVAAWRESQRSGVDPNDVIRGVLGMVRRRAADVVEFLREREWDAGADDGSDDEDDVPC
jgi:hypothetical protein